MKNVQVSFFAGLLFSCLLVTPVSAQSLSEKTVYELQDLMGTGLLTSEELVRFYLDRIETVDKGDNGLHSIIMVNPDALNLARALDTERTLTGPRGMLHGIPVLIKDNIDTADNMPNTAGSLLLKDNFPKSDAEVVRQLRAEGAIIFGKANLSEWANFRGFFSLNGWSAVGGQTQNPYKENTDPCGSSSGSAVAVSANLTAVAIGTETSGSLTCPASMNGAVSIKPSAGLVSQDGIIPVAQSFDTAGPITRTVADTALLLEVIDNTDINFTSHLKPDGLEGKRIGVVDNFLIGNEDVLRLFNQSLDDMTRKGAVIVRGCSLMLNIPHEQAYSVLLTEFRYGINQYLEQANISGVSSLDDLIKGNDRFRDKELKYFGQEHFFRAKNALDISDKKYQDYLQKVRRRAGTLGIGAALKRCSVDMFVAPTTHFARKMRVKAEINLEPTEGHALQIMGINPVLGIKEKENSPEPITYWAAMAGYPHLTVPMGFHQGLPVGVSFVSALGKDALLIEAGYAYEQATKHRRAP